MLSKTEFKSLAQRYEEAISSENSLVVRQGYSLFMKECYDQFKQIPIQVIFIDKDPYLRSKDLFENIDKGFMRVFTGGEVHPLLTIEENAVFRAVHDYFGHYKTRGNFKPEGEYKAWQAHSLMFSERARLVLNTETIAQVAVYFYGSKPKTYAKQKALLLNIK